MTLVKWSVRVETLDSDTVITTNVLKNIRLEGVGGGWWSELHLECVHRQITFVVRDYILKSPMSQKPIQLRPVSPDGLKLVICRTDNLFARMRW